MNLMKKFSRRAILLFVILTFLFSVSVEKAEATCPSGYTSASKTFSYNADTNTCSYIVNYCYKCSPSSNGTDIIITSIESPDFGCFVYMSQHLRAVLNYAKDLLASNIVNLCSIPPCDQQMRKTISVISATCAISFRDNTNNIVYFDCGDNPICTTTYESACLDYTFSPPKLTYSSKSSSQSSGTPNCDIYDPIPIPNYGQYTSCYRILCQ